MKPAAGFIPLLSVTALAQAPNAPNPGLKLDLRVDPLENPDHLKDIELASREDLARVLQENGIRVAAPGEAILPRLTLQPRVARLPHGVIGFCVVGYLDDGASKEFLRAFTATALRDPANVRAGVRQAMLDATANVTVRLSKAPPGTPVKRLLVPGAEELALTGDLVPLERLKARVRPFPPVLPPLARARGIFGATRTVVTIGQDGIPVRADFIEGPPELSLIVLSHAMDWSFVPLAQQGLKGPLRTEIKVDMSPNLGVTETGLPPRKD